MTKLKQKSITDATGSRVTFTLHKFANPMKDLRNTPYLYEIRIDGSTDEEAFTRTEADRTFKQVIKNHKRGAEMSANDRGGGLFGDPSDSLPGFGNGGVR